MVALLLVNILGNKMDWSIMLWGTIASLAAGLATGLGALPVFFLKDISEKALDILLGFAAGAMIFVVADEIIPETHRVDKGYSRMATYGLVAGFVFMLFLDNFIEPFLTNIL